MASKASAVIEIEIMLRRPPIAMEAGAPSFARQRTAVGATWRPFLVKSSSEGGKARWEASSGEK